MIQEDITLVLIIKNNVSLNFIYYQNIELYKNIFPPIIYKFFGSDIFYD